MPTPPATSTDVCAEGSDIKPVAQRTDDGERVADSQTREFARPRADDDDHQRDAIAVTLVQSKRRCATLAGREERP